LRHLLPADVTTIYISKFKKENDEKNVDCLEFLIKFENIEENKRKGG
jgi:hypothetical protein